MDESFDATSVDYTDGGEDSYVVSDALAAGRRVIAAGKLALDALSENLDDRLIEATNLILACSGRIIVVGMGKSGIAARKLVGTLSSLGTAAQFLHASDALHGDLGSMRAGDVVIAISVSGSSTELLQVVWYALEHGIGVIGITANLHSRLAEACGIVLRLPRVEEGCALSIAPMASTIATIALGDALAAMVTERRHFGRRELFRLHPQGAIGTRLRPVRTIMHGGARMPLVSTDATAMEAIDEIDAKGFGITGVVDPRSGRLSGAISDGDLRRHLQCPAAIAADLMTRDPVALHVDSDVEQALDVMRNNRISAVFIVNEDAGQPIGIVHVQDILRTGII